MAIEWTTAEAVKKVRENNGAAIVDLGKRFPLFTHFASNVNTAGVELMVLSGLTPQQWNNKLKALINTDEAEEAEPVKKASGRGRKPAAAKAAPKKRAPKKVEPVEDLDDEDLDEDEEEEDEELEEVKPAPKKRAPKKAAPKKRAPRKPVVIEEDDEEDLEDDEEEFDDFDDFDDMEEF